MGCSTCCGRRCDVRDPVALFTIGDWWLFPSPSPLGGGVAPFPRPLDGGASRTAVKDLGVNGPNGWKRSWKG